MTYIALPISGQVIYRTGEWDEAVGWSSTFGEHIRWIANTIFRTLVEGITEAGVISNPTSTNVPEFDDSEVKIWRRMTMFL